MRIEAKGKKSEKGINYIGFETREIVPGGRVVSVRVQFIFFFSVFPLVTSRVGRMRIEAKKRINYICFQTREIVPCDGLASVWAQVIYFLFSS